MPDKVTTRELPLPESTQPERRTDVDSEAAEFRTKVVFMFLIPAALFVFLGVCAAMVALPA